MKETTTCRKPSVTQPWKKYYSPEALAQTIPQLTCYRYLREMNKDNLKNPAINYYGKKVTYGELFRRIEETANAFHAQGIRAGDRVSIISVGIVESICTIYALNKIGATANMIDPRMDVDSIRRMILNSQSSVTLVLDIAFPKLEKIMADVAQKRIIVQSAARSLPFVKKIAMTLAVRTKIPYGDTIIDWDAFLSEGKGNQAEEAPYVGDAVVAITHTGGTTGFPKGVMLTNDSMNAVSINFRYAGMYHELGDRFLDIIPLFTSYGMVCGMHMPLCLNMELVPIPKFVPDEFGKLVKSYRPNHMISTPAFYEMMMESTELANMDLSFITTMGSGGDTMNEGLEKKLSDFMVSHHIRYPMAQGYGMSEVSAAASFNVNDIFKSGSVGIPSVTTTIGVFDPETGEEMDFNQQGEICITGPSVMKGYFNQPEETALVLRRHEDGQIWVHSGDIGYLDEDGFLFIKGRVKRMITRFDGHKVFPVNIESLVCAQENVHNCCVIGVNDQSHGQGQYPLVVIEPAEGMSPAAVCSDVYALCQRELEERGKPVAVMAVEKIPLTGAGKNDYRTLEKKYGTYDYMKWDPLRR